MLLENYVPPTKVLTQKSRRNMIFMLLGEFRVFKRVRERERGKWWADGGWEKGVLVILPHEWSHRNVNLVVRLLEWII